MLISVESNLTNAFIYNVMYSFARRGSAGGKKESQLANARGKAKASGGISYFGFVAETNFLAN